MNSNGGVGACVIWSQKNSDIGCLALQTAHGQHLVDFKRKLITEIGTDKVQLVTISRPSAYGEYEPYRFVDTEQEFEQAVKRLWQMWVVSKKDYYPYFMIDESECDKMLIYRQKNKGKHSIIYNFCPWKYVNL